MQKTQPENSGIFSTVHLPTLPQTLIRLMEVCNDPERDIVLVGKTVAQDMSIASKILKLANSAFLGTRAKFASIEQAVIYLGIDTVRNLAISVSVHVAFQDGNHFRNINIEEFWYHSLLTALLAKEIAEQTGFDDPAEAYLAGLLHDTGRCLLSDRFPEQYGKLLEEQKGTYELVVEEKEAFGVTHADAGAWLAENWHLNTSVGKAIGLHHTPPLEAGGANLLDRIIYLANLLSDNRQTDKLHIEQIAALLRLKSADLGKLLAAQQAIVMDIAGLLGISARAPASPEDRPVAPEPAGNLTEKVKSLAKVYGMLDNLNKAQSLNRVFSVIEESLQILFGSEKSILLLPDEENSKLSAQGSFRNRLVRSLRNLQISLPGEGTWLSSCLQANGLGKIERKDHSQTDPAVDSLFKTFAEPSLVTRSFAIDETRQGILILAQGNDNGSLQELEEGLFLLLSHLGSRLHLENLKRQHAEALVKERINTMEELARSLAHEISTPLSIIQNYVSLLANKADLVGNLREILNIIGSEIERIGRLSNQLNDLSALPRKSGQELTDVAALISDTVHLFQQSAELNSNISITFDAEENLPQIWLKTDALRQILNNLLSNSLDAIGTSGNIELKCSCKAGNDTTGEEIIVTVTDDGPGVDPSIIDRLFKVGQTTKGEGHAGLGLAIVQKLTADLGGRIHHAVDTKSRTQFVLHLPVND